MRLKRLVVLANSYKKKPGRCVAGRELGEVYAAGKWIRPISNEPEGELLPRHMKTEDGSPLQVLDIMDVPIGEYAEDKIHPEDWFIDNANPWRRVNKLAAKNLVALEEKPRDLWMDPATRADRATPAFLIKRIKHQSLYLIRPTDFRAVLTNDFNPFEGRNQQKRRARFTYRGQDYSLGLTDPLFIGKYAAKFPAPDKPAIVVRPRCGDHCLLCVSLTPVFNGYHYKVVAAVLELP
ncbi:MAG: hypothetical protein IT445_07305 [Phycisphaeraceae bacterium]|nr:hypothetical protein [Phycisphaeraceae bacterium]